MEFQIIINILVIGGVIYLIGRKMKIYPFYISDGSEFIFEPVLRRADVMVELIHEKQIVTSSSRLVYQPALRMSMPVSYTHIEPEKFIIRVTGIKISYNCEFDDRDLFFLLQHVPVSRMHYQIGVNKKNEKKIKPILLETPDGEYLLK